MFKLIVLTMRNKKGFIMHADWSKVLIFHLILINLKLFLLIITSLTLELKKIFSNIASAFLGHLNTELLELNLGIVMINKDDFIKDKAGDTKDSLDPKDKNPYGDNLKSDEEHNRIKRIEDWFNKDQIDEKEKEELINSGKDFSKDELNEWMMEKDRKNYELQELQDKEQDQELKKKIYDWLEKVEEKKDTDQGASSSGSQDLNSNSNPVSEWSSSSSDNGGSSVSKVNFDIDKLTDYTNWEFSNHDSSYMSI